MAEENIQTNAPEQDLSEILKVRREKLAALRAEGRDPFKETRFDVTHHAQDIKDNFDALEGSEVRVAGRLMSKRGMGKVSFCDLQDKSGRIQLYARKDEMDEEEYNRFKKYDIGDIVGVEGEVFRTQRGEMSVRAKKITLLSKSLRPLPEKYHGLTDKEARYRQRYVDLIINPESKRNFEIRSKFVAYLRRYLDSIGFMEVETPVLSPIAGGANARPFITHHNTLDIDMYMRIATELHLKRVIEALERVDAAEKKQKDEDKPDEDSDPLLMDCIELAVDAGQISASMIQRKYRVGYARAGRILDQMEQRGCISGFEGSKPRQTLITREQFYEMAGVETDAPPIDEE